MGLLLFVVVINAEILLPFIFSNVVFTQKKSTVLIYSTGRLRNASKAYCLHSLPSLIRMFCLQ